MVTNIEVIIIDEVFCSLFYVANAFWARSHRKMLLFLFLFKAYDPLTCISRIQLEHNNQQCK